MRPRRKTLERKCHIAGGSVRNSSNPVSIWSPVLALASEGKSSLERWNPSTRKHYHDASSRLFLRPFPQQPPAGMTLKDFWTKYRKEMLEKEGVCVFVSGNKLNAATGSVEDANGVFEEFEIASSLGKYLIPIGATGHAAKKLWEKVSGDPDKYFPDGGVKRHFKTLGKDTRTDEELVDAVIGILKQIKAVH